MTAVCRPDNLIIVTGPLHSGKTSLLMQFDRKLRDMGWQTAGILAIGLWRNNQRSGFELIDLQTGTKHPLAIRRQFPDERQVFFDFHEKGMAAGRTALSPERCKGADVVIIDEIGKLEVAGDGWASCIEPLNRLSLTAQIWAVRNSLVDTVIARWKVTPLVVIDCTEPNALNQLWETVSVLRETL
jgi:nucleoside-triphosphatase THEP1